MLTGNWIIDPPPEARPADEGQTVPLDARCRHTRGSINWTMVGIVVIAGVIVAVLGEFAPDLVGNDVPGPGLSPPRGRHARGFEATLRFSDGFAYGQISASLFRLP